VTPSIIATKKVLMAEDDVYNMRPTIDALEVAGATVKVARSGSDALAELEQGNFDLLILDIMMAAGDRIKTEDQGRSTGITLYLTIRDNISKSLPIVVSTVVTDPQVLDTFKSDPRCSVLRKPYDFRELVSAIESVIPKG
jgi:CheY-like chemotaxis protein